MAMGTFFILILLVLVLGVVLVGSVVLAILLVMRNRRREARGFEVQPLQGTRGQ